MYVLSKRNTKKAIAGASLASQTGKICDLASKNGLWIAKRLYYYRKIEIAIGAVPHYKRNKQRGNCCLKTFEKILQTKLSAFS